MEHREASPETNWGSFGSSVQTEDPEIMALLFSNTSLADESQGWQSIDFLHPSVVCSDHEAAQPNYYGCTNTNDAHNGMYYWPQGCGGSHLNVDVNVPVHGATTDSYPPNPDAENYGFCDPAEAGGQPAPGGYPAVDFFTADEKSSADGAAQDRTTTTDAFHGEPFGAFAGEANSVGGHADATGFKFLDLASSSSSPPPPPPPSDTKPPSGKRRIPLPESDMPAPVDGKETVNVVGLNPRKKSRSTADLQKSGKSTVNQQRKTQKGGGAKASLSDDTGLVRQTSSSESSEDDSIASQDANGDGGTSSISKGNVKTRAGRGSATDPQSLYARKRRERINERLRILQNLVPNGTKVDISTMLEEAVQYVKFLQLQIKLLSSDDLWMYAPIAYNGMDIGLDLKITPPQ